MPEDEKTVDETTNETEKSWQDVENKEDTTVENTEDTQKEDTSVDDFFNSLFQDADTDDKKEEGKKETPTEDPFHNPEKKSDIYEKQIEQLTNDAKAKEEELNKVKPVLEAFEKDPTLKKFVDSVVSWKLTVEWVFKQFAESQIEKTVKKSTPSTGTVPHEKWMADRLQRIAQSRRATFENTTPKG